MPATFTKTFVATLSLGFAFLATPALANGYDRHDGCNGPIVDGDNGGGYSKAYIDATGCSQVSFEQAFGDNFLAVEAEDAVKIAVQNEGGGKTEIQAKDISEVGSYTRDGYSNIKTFDDGRAANRTQNGITYILGSGGSDTIVDNDGGKVRSKNSGSGMVKIRVAREPKGFRN